MNKTYKILLLCWITIGLTISGYFYVFPPIRTFYRLNPSFIESFGRTYKGVDIRYFQVSLLVTIIVVILIGGLGYILSKKDNGKTQK